MFADFLSFLHVAGISISQVNTIVLLAFMEFLTLNKLSQSNISNHMAGIRAMFILYGLDTASFKDERINLFIKALKINQPFQPRFTKVISIQLLSQIVESCRDLRDPILFKALYLFMFYSFLRLSNVLPHSIKAFDPSRHLTRGDLIFSETGCTVIIKWSKTLQTRRDIKTIVIPKLRGSHLCPVSALSDMFQAYPASRNDPLFSLVSPTGVIPLSDSIARKHLKSVSTSLLLEVPLTFHFFRKSGTSWAFQHGVPLQDIIGPWDMVL